MGIGKSSLVNELLGKYLAEEHLPVTDSSTEIKEYKLAINVTDKSINESVDIVIVDCPGLGDPLNDEEANLSEISKHCRDADLLIYCLDMRGRMTLSDTKGMKEFTQRVGPDVWKNAMFVLTFAHKAVPSTPKPRSRLETLTFGYFVSAGDSERKEKFEALLAEWEKAILRFLRDTMNIPEEITNSICVVPAGYRKFSPPDRADWLSELWFTAISKCKKEVQPDLVGINFHHFKITASGGRTLTEEVRL